MLARWSARPVRTFVRRARGPPRRTAARRCGARAPSLQQARPKKTEAGGAAVAVAVAAAAVAGGTAPLAPRSPSQRASAGRRLRELRKRRVLTPAARSATGVVAAYMLAKQAGKDGSAADIKAILSAAGVEADDAKIELLLKEVRGGARVCAKGAREERIRGCELRAAR